MDVVANAMYPDYGKQSIQPFEPGVCTLPTVDFIKFQPFNASNVDILDEIGDVEAKIEEVLTKDEHEELQESFFIFPQEFRGGDIPQFFSASDFTVDYVPSLDYVTNSIKRCGQDVQRLSVVTSLPHLLRDSSEECLRRVMPKIREFLPVAQLDMQLAASATFLQIFQSNLVQTSVFSQQFLPIILTGLDYKDPAAVESWLETLLTIIPSLSKEVIRKEVLTKAIQKGHLSQSVQSRLTSCKILGKICICVESYVINKEILPIVQSLCQDVEYEVRACMCRQLDLVAKGLGLESTRSAILPELVELANDEESSVRLAGLDTVVSILGLLDNDTCVQTIIPLVMKFCQGALQDEDSTLPVVSKHLGKLCHGLSSNMSASQKAWFIDFFKKLCAMGSKESAPSDKNDINSNLANKGLYEDDWPVECRINAAYNFPAMTLFTGPGTAFPTDLYDTFSKLCKDQSVSVRKTMAHGFHEVAGAIGSHVTLLLKDLIVLFKDEYIDVLRGLVQSLTETVDIFSKAVNTERYGASLEFLSAVLSSERVIFSSNDWRLQEAFIDKISCLAKLYNNEHIYNRVVPLVFNTLHNGKALPVRLAACRTILVLLRSTKRLEQRTEMINKIINEFGKGKSFRNRALFTDICHEVLQRFSRSFFKENFYEHVLNLSSDPVPNIRLRLCGILPQLKHTIRLPNDRNLLQQLESHVRKLLINEKDRDVLSKLETTVHELDRISCIHDTLHSRRNITDEDLTDQSREEEERLLIEMEEKEKEKDETDQSQSKKKGGKQVKNVPPSQAVSLKSNLEKKTQQPSAGKVSKIPTQTPAIKEPSQPRRLSQTSMKIPSVAVSSSTSGSVPPATNGASASGTAASLPSGPVKNPGSASTRSTKVSPSNRVSSASAANSGGSINNANTSRTGHTLSSAGRKRSTDSGENLKLDNVTSLTRRLSKDSSLNKKLSDAD